MSENLFTVLGLSPGPVSDAQLAAAYEKRLARCRRRIRDENVLAAREERLIYAYAVLRDPRRRAEYLRRHTAAPIRMADPEPQPVAAEEQPAEAEPPRPHGGNKPDAIRRLCATIDNAIIGGAIDPLRRRAIHARARVLGVTRFETELLMASALRRDARRRQPEAQPADPPRSRLALLVTCLGIILLAIFLCSRL
jgi:hypothetical protein